MLVLALESSTSSAKAILYDSGLGVVDAASARYAPAYCKAGVSGTEEVFRQTLEMGRRVAEGRDVRAVALCGVWHSIAVCDSSMHPAGGTFTWNYLAPAAQCRSARADDALAGALYRRTGCMPHATYMRETLRFLGGNGLCLKDKLLPTQAGYNFFRMTGERLETRNIMSGTGLLNLDSLEYDPFALEYAGIDKAQLGPLGGYRDVRPLNAFAAGLLGIAPGIPVVPAHADGALNQISCGAAVPGRMTMSVGTSGAIRLTTSRPVLPAGRELWCYRGVDGYMSGAAASSACNAIEWFRETFLGARLSFDALEGNAALSEDLPVFLPFIYGERNPGWRDDRLGGFVDVRPTHTVHDMYLALQAGILFNLYQCFEVLSVHAGCPGEIYLSGGILNSPRWTRLAADVFDRPMRCVRDTDASTVGAAVLALHAAGAAEDIFSFDGEALRAATVEPDTARAQCCRRLYARYLEHYGAP